MLVILNYLDGDFEVIHYERKRLETYLAQQIKSTATFDKMDYIRIEWGMHHELDIPKGVKVNRFLRNRLECSVDATGGTICLPCITLQICEDEEAIMKHIDPNQIAFKDIVVYPIKVERQLIRLFNLAKENKHGIFKKKKKTVDKPRRIRRPKGKSRVNKSRNTRRKS